MKNFSAILFCLMLITPGIGMAEIINDAIVGEYYDKGKEAYDRNDWVVAVEYFFTYQELNKINNPNKPSEVTELIQYSEKKIHEKCSQQPPWPMKNMKGMKGMKGD